MPSCADALVEHRSCSTSDRNVRGRSFVRSKPFEELGLLLAALREQGQQRAPELFHLLFGLRTGRGRVWGEQGVQSGVFGGKPVAQGTQSGILGREPVVLGCESCDLLLRDPRLDLRLVPLLLADRKSV